MVIATQNPIEQAGTYRLPEAQLDRFLMKTSVGYPDAESTEELLLGSAGSATAPRWSTPVVSRRGRPEMTALAGEVYVDRAIVRYVRAARRGLAASSRTCRWGSPPAAAWPSSGSPRPGPPPTVGPRRARRHHHPGRSRCCATGCCSTPQAQFSGVSVDDVIERLLAAVPPPRATGHG